MENNKNHNKGPQDSVKNTKYLELKEFENNSHNKEPQDNILGKKKLKNEKEDNQIKIKKEEQKLSNNSLNQESKIENQINNFSNELDNILACINVVWEKNPDGYDNYYKTDICPKMNEFLAYPCITVFREKILLIFKFLCKYFLSRKNYLKEIPQYEILQMIEILTNKFNIFSLTPNNLNTSDFELIEDIYFYQILQEILTFQNIENTYENLNDKNCMYKYFIEFLFQCGYIDSYIDNILTRNDLSQGTYAQICFFPFIALNYCDKNFLIKKNYNIKMIINFNSKINFYLSNKNPLLNNVEEMNKFGNYITNNFLDMLFGIFNHLFDELILNYKLDCEMFCITVFKISEFFLKNQKINIRIFGVYLTSYLCGLYRNFIYDNYKNKYNYIEKIYPFSINCAIVYLKKINIFNLIFGENIHEGVIQRAYPILSFLYRNKSFSHEQIQILWNLSLTKYQSISNSIITLFGQLLPEFSNEDCNSILNIVSKINYKDVKETTLKLLENFSVGNERRELLLNILFKFSDESSFEKGLEKNIIIKSREILVKLLFNKNYIDDLVKYIKQCVIYINNFYLVNTYSSNLMQILDEFERIKNTPIAREIYKKFDKKITNSEIMIYYLDENFKIFPVYINLLINIIKLFKFFFIVTLNTFNELNKGNFNLQQLLNIDNLFNEYKNYIRNNMNIYYNLNNSEDDKMKIDINFEINNNLNFNNSKNEKILINEFDYEKYIKNIIKDFILFINEEFLSNNIFPSNDEIKKSIFEKLKIFLEKINYNNCISKILIIIYNNHIRGNIHFKISYLNCLYNIGQETQDIDPSIEWYYKLLFDLFNYQINNNKKNLLKDENLEYLLKEHINKSDYRILPHSAFKIVHSFCIYLNYKKDNAIYSSSIQKYIGIKGNTFYGFEIIWKFFFSTKNELIYNQALNILMNMLELLLSKNIQTINKFINDIFDFIQKNKNQIKNDQEIKIGIIRNLKLMSLINRVKINKNNSELNNNKGFIEVTIKNYYFLSYNSSDNVSKIKVSKEVKIKDLKEYLINNIICTPNNLNFYNLQINYKNNLAIDNSKEGMTF